MLLLGDRERHESISGDKPGEVETEQRQHVLHR
jgi:hypothetical protein